MIERIQLNLDDVLTDQKSELPTQEQKCLAEIFESRQISILNYPDQINE